MVCWLKKLCRKEDVIIHISNNIKINNEYDYIYYYSQLSGL